MKKIFTISTIIALGSLIAFACKKSTTTTTTPTTTPTTQGTLSYIVSGTTYTSTAIGSAATASTGTNITVQYPTSSNASNIVELYLNNVTGTGTYTLNSSSGATGSGNEATYSTNASSNITQYWTTPTNTGIATVTSLDVTHGLISGTFSFTAVQWYPTASPAPTVNITNGVFTNVNY
jgi:hypothetical protein